VDDPHCLFVSYLGIDDNAIATRRNGATLSDFRVGRFGEDCVFKTACYQASEPY